MRPTGKLHLGHVVGALNNWVKLQNEYECFHFIADWHALTSDYADTSRIRENRIEMMVDWLAAGLDPKKSVMFVQSAVPQHAELHLLLSMITPLGWLERVPTYKEQRDNITDKDLGNYGFLGYPVLQSADILMYKGNYVPVGEDQVPHVELTREICRRFNSYYGDVFPEPQALLTPVPRLPGLDGRKMSKSYGNDISLSDTPEEITKKIKTMMTDPARKRRTDPGNPDVCPVFAYHKIYSTKETIQTVDRECRVAGIGCIDCKKWMSERLIEDLSPLLQRRREYAARTDEIKDIIADGNVRANVVATQTMGEVREAVKLS
jgi:tryptophanyl-tRNA synthetase